jgi:hypothetical protein
VIRANCDDGNHQWMRIIDSSPLRVGFRKNASTTHAWFDS